MQTQKDHVDADRFQSARVADAITYGTELHLEPRARRAGTGLLVGAIVALLAIIGCGVYGLIQPGGATSWREPGAIILNKDTGARMVYRDAALHEVRNYASALLVEGTAAHVVSTSSASLVDVPLGGLIGIIGAPETVPPSSGLLSSAMLLCASASEDGTAALTLLGDGPSAADPFGTDRFALVRDQSGKRWVVDGSHRYSVDDELVPLVLGMQAQAQVTVSDAWLATRAVGIPLTRPIIPGAGGAGPEIAGRGVRIGSLFTYTAANGREEGLVALGDGLALVPPMEFALLRAHASNVPALTAAQVGAVPTSRTTVPARLPDLVTSRPIDLSRTALCAVQQADGTAQSTLRTLSASGSSFAGAKSGVLNVRLDVGQGVYALATSATGSAVQQELSTAPRYLVLGDGKKYRVRTGAAAAALGYGSESPRPVAPALLQLLPDGAALSRAAVGAADR